MKAVYTLADLRDWERVTADEPVPLRLAVLGDPVAHSASPQMHNAAMEALKLPVRYCRLHIHPNEFEEVITLLVEKRFVGVNCTIPHKAAALAAVTKADENACRAGGVNTVVFGEGDHIQGFSTDGPGLARAVKEQLGVDLAGQRILVLGAGGGAGRAVAMQCASDGAAALTLVNRSVEKLEPLGEVIAAFYPREHLKLGEWSDATLAETLGAADLVINCSALGMKADDPSPIPAKLLSGRHLVYDTIYTAHRTPLMLAADAAGARSANGLSMLLHQGALAFEHWFQRAAPLEVMRAALAR